MRSENTSPYYYPIAMSQVAITQFRRSWRLYVPATPESPPAAWLGRPLQGGSGQRFQLLAYQPRCGGQWTARHGSCTFRSLTPSLGKAGLLILHRLRSVSLIAFQSPLRLADPLISGNSASVIPLATLSSGILSRYLRLVWA
jgi:hypothetical protein